LTAGLRLLPLLSSTGTSTGGAISSQVGPDEFLKSGLGGMKEDRV